MGQGIQIWNASGVLIMDTSTWCGQVLGNFALASGHGTGSITDANLALGRPFVCVSPTSSAAGTVLTLTSASVSGTTLSYTAGGACQIVYGIY